MSDPSVIIIGAGPAGLGAARALRRRGVEDVVILEREADAGGVPRHCGHWGFGLSEAGRLMTGGGYARWLAAGVPAQWIRTGMTVTRLKPEGLIEVSGAEGIGEMRAKAVLLATGIRETPRSARLISGTRPLGVTTTGALQQAVYRENFRPFVSPVILGSELVSFSVLLTCRHAGIRPVAMIEEGSRIIARRPGDLIARWAFGVPILTDTRIVAIHGQSAVESVEIERQGRRQILACDGVIATGRFTPESALVRPSHVALDEGTKGPAIDQHWRTSDAVYFAAGNLLRGVETAACAFAEGCAAGEAIAAHLAGALPIGRRAIPIERRGALSYVYPASVTLPGLPVGPLLLRARAARRVRGHLWLAIDGRKVWERRIDALPERRLSLPGSLIPLTEGLTRIEAGLD